MKGWYWRVIVICDICNSIALGMYDIDLLRTLLSACQMHGELEFGEEIAELLLMRDPMIYQLTLSWQICALLAENGTKHAKLDRG